MVKFLLFNFFGALAVALTNSFFRANPFNWSLFSLLCFMAIPTVFGIQYCFASSYRIADSFFQAWFVGSAFTSVVGFLTSVFIFGEQVVFLNIVGVILIIGGAYCLLK